MRTMVTNYWKTSIDKRGFYFEPFSLSVYWGNEPRETKHITIVLLNFEISFTWKPKRRFGKRIILKHPNGWGQASFDWLVKKEAIIPIKVWDKINTLYQVNCRYVKKFLKEHPEYEYLGSEDLDHAPEVNRGIMDFVKECEKSGFEIVEMESLDRGK